MLKRMNGDTAGKIKGWCHVCYTDATIAVIIGIVVTGSFLIAGAGVLRPLELAPDGPGIAVTLSQIFSANWGRVGAILFLVAGAAALLSTQIGQLAGWPRLLSDCCRICLPSLSQKFSGKSAIASGLSCFFDMVIIHTASPVALVKIVPFSMVYLTPLQAVVSWVLFIVMPKVLSPEAARILKPAGYFF
jgi:hypothetical protein